MEPVKSEVRPEVFVPQILRHEAGDNQENCAGAAFARGDFDALKIANEDVGEDWRAAEKYQEIRQRGDVHRWRKIYLGRSFYLVAFLIYVSMLFVLFASMGLFKMSDGVLITLLTTTLANVIGILIVAFHWLYREC